MDIINNYDFLLCFGKNIKTPEVELPEIAPLHGKQNVFVDINQKELSLSLSGLKFTRKVYQHGLIEAQVTVKPVSGNDGSKAELPTFDEVERLFLRRQAELVLVDLDKARNEGDGESYNLDGDVGAKIAKNYYVYMINPQITTVSGTKEMFVKLTIHSFDKLMDIDKYCKAFTNKKLSSGILANEINNFGLPATMLNADMSNLRNLVYQHDGKTVEMIQPYLVQYNETFYDFMVRTANRCGEYLFFEGGKLTLGLPTTTTKEVKSYQTVTMQGYTDGAVEVEDYSRDSVKDDENINGDLNYDAIAKDASGYPTDSFPAKMQYNSPLAGEEYIFPLDDDKYNNLNRELGLRSKSGQWAKTMTWKSFAAITSNEDGDALKMAEKLGLQMAQDSANAAILMKSADEKAVKDLSKKGAEHYSGGRYVQFSSVDSKGWLNHQFYGKIRRDEEKLHKKIVCIDMGTNYAPVALGDKIKIDDLSGDYIVIQIKQIANMTWDYDFRKFDPTDNTTDLYSDRQSQVIYAIPVGHPMNDNGEPDTTKDLVMPPVAPVPMFRKAEPQTAFVIDNGDKKYQGRVRISYPWQSSVDSKRKELFEAEESLRKAEQDLKDTDEKKALLLGLLNTLKQSIQPKLEELEKMNKEQVKAYCKQLEEENETNKGRLAEIQKQLEKLPAAIGEEDYKDISVEDYMKLENDRKKLQADYAELQKKIDENDKLVAYLKNSDYDAKEGLDQLDKDEKAAENDIIAQNAAIAKAKSGVESAEKAVQERKEGWEKDLANDATPWIRVVTPMASSGGGVYFKPNKGDEVLINYDSGNIERPYVVGSVYSKNTLDPNEYVNKFSKNYLQKNASMMMMSPNGQHISFVAPSDGWKFFHPFLPTLKTLQFYWPDLKFKDLNWYDVKDLSGGIFMGDRFGMYELSLSSHDRKVTIKSPYGNVEIGAFSGITIKAPNGDIKISGKNVSIEAGNKLTLQSGKNITDPKSFGENCLEMLKMALSAPMNGTIGNIANLKLIDLSLFRSVVEVFTRPIDGTLNVKSKNYLMLEAGKGKAKVPLDRYSKNYQEKLKMQDTERMKVYGKIAGYIKLINSKVTQFEKDYKELKKVAYEKKAKYNAAFDLFWNLDQKLPDVIAPVFSLAEEKDFVDNNEDFTGGTLAPTMAEITQGKLIAGAGGEYQVYGHDSLHDLDAVKAYIQPIAQDYGRAIIQMLVKTADFYSLCNDNTIKDLNMSVLKKEKDDDTKWIDDVFKNTIFEGNNCEQHKFFLKWIERYGDNQPTVNFMNVNDKESKDDPFYDMLVIRRHMIAKFLLALRNNGHNRVANPVPLAPTFNKYFDICYGENDLTDAYLKEKWSLVASLSSKVPGKWDKTKDILNVGADYVGLKGLADIFKDPFNLLGDKNTPYRGWGAPRMWNDKNGQILFSSDKDATYTFEKGAVTKLDQISWSNPDLVKDLLKSIK